jgi:AcrR family transcriptional regulator
MYDYLWEGHGNVAKKYAGVWFFMKRKQERIIPNAIAAHREAVLHKQKRAMLTRREILRSARAVFSRDGFEHARIEEIAAKAGKTRGAFYDNFKDKEDVFFAIFEENYDRDLAELGPVIGKLPTLGRRVEALGAYLCELSKDRERMLLNLEFKLYAIRHPRKRRRLAALYAAMRVRGSIPELSRLLPQLSDKNSSTQDCDAFAICGLLDGLALSRFFNPEAFDHRELVHYMKLCLREALNGMGKKKPALMPSLL